MTKSAQNILEYLVANTGRPTAVADLVDAGIASKVTIHKQLRQLADAGYVYMAGDYIYPTTYATQFMSSGNTSNISPREEYAHYLEPGQGTTYENKEQVYEYLSENFNTYYKQYKRNHPEYSRFFAWVESSSETFKVFVTESLGIALNWVFDRSLDNTFEGEEEYIRPESVNTLEAAIDEEVSRFKTHMTYFNHLFDSRDDYKKAYDSVKDNTIYEKVLEDVLAKGNAVGTVLSKRSIQSIAQKTISQISNVGNVVDSLAGTITNRVEDYIRTHSSSIVLESYTPAEVANILMSTATFVVNFDVFRNTAAKTAATFEGRDAYDLASAVLKAIPELPTNLARIDLHGLTLERLNFAGRNLSNSDWSNALVTGCSFDNASLEGAIFAVDSLRDSSIQNTDFTNANANIDAFDWDSITGTPTNLSSSTINVDTEGLKEVIEDTPGLTSSSIPIAEEDYADGVLIARALQQYLSKHITFSSRLRTTSAISEDISNQLRQWLDGGQEPTFDYGGNLIAWLQQHNKTQDLRNAGFTNKEVNKLFGKARGVVKTPKQDLAKIEKEKQDREISNFVNTYGDSTYIPTDALLDMLDNKESNLAYWIQGYGKQLNQNQVFALYNSLVSTIKQFHVPEGVRGQLKRKYEAFPYNAYLSDLRSTRHNVAGSGEQFGVALTPNYSSLPPRLRGITELTVTQGSAHLENAICFARINPIKVSSITFPDGSSSKKSEKNVWFITEMQADDFQKLGSKDANIINRVKTKYGPEAVAEYRRFYRHWPETLLSVIVDLANRHDVDELWMPEHTEVEAKTNGGKTSVSAPGQVPNWYNAYDRPAKAFGGQLQGIGNKIVLDPSSYYDRETDSAYVIHTSGNPKTAGLDLTFFNSSKHGEKLLTFGAKEDYNWDEIRNLLAHHIDYIINENRPKFPEVEKYVTDNQIAQFGWATFFDEYPDMKQNLGDPEFVEELRRVFTEDLGYKFMDPPYIDWLHWMQKAWDDVRYFIRNQKQITPDLNLTDQELARDWYTLWQDEQVPSDILAASWFKDIFEDTVVVMLEDKGLGSIRSTDYILPPKPEDKDLDLLFNPPDNDEGETEYVDQNGDTIGEDDLFNDVDLSFDTGTDTTEEDYTISAEDQIDLYLDQLNKALEDGDYEVADELRKRLQELTRPKTNSSLDPTHAWRVDLPTLRVLRAVKPDNDAWMHATEGELVMPDMFSSEYAFYGLSSRKGSQYARIDSSDEDLRYLAELDAKSFWSGSWNPLSPDEQEGIIMGKLQAYEDILKDISNLPDGTIIKMVGRPEDGPNWFEIYSKPVTAWKVPPPVSAPDSSFSKGEYEVFYERYGNAKFRKTGAKGMIISTLGAEGPTRLIDLWRKYVSEIKHMDPDTLTPGYRGERPFYQSLSATATGLKHYGIVSASGGVYSLTAYGYMVYHAGKDDSYYRILPPNDPELKPFFHDKEVVEDDMDTGDSDDSFLDYLDDNFFNSDSEE